MPDLKPLTHVDAEKKDDAALRREAEAHFLATPALQVVAELMAKLRARAVPWWSADDQRAWWNATERMRWLRQRPDLRAQITSSLTGLSHAAARKKTPEFQGSLLDSFLEDGDITLRQLDDGFDPVDLVVYGPVGAMWRKFRERMPWDQDTPVHQELVAFLLRALLGARSTLRGATREALLTAWAVRSAIPSGIWQSRIPADVRASIDDARLQREKCGEPFHAAHELAIATPEVIAASIPLRELAGVLDLAQSALGCDPGGSTRPPSGRPTREPTVTDTDAMLASIARRASVSVTPPLARADGAEPARPSSATSPGRAGNGDLSLSSPSPSPSPLSVMAAASAPRGARRGAARRAVWPDDVEVEIGDVEDMLRRTRRDDEDTQPRAVAAAR
ncbi:MAG: hypothetical protein NVSMB47_02740 [Polyangiales bacterium]